MFLAISFLNFSFETLKHMVNVILLRRVKLCFNNDFTAVRISRRQFYFAGKSEYE